MRPTLHRLTDLAASRALRVDRYYPDGFGDRGRLSKLVEGVVALRADLAEPEVEVRWSGPARRVFGVSLRQGRFLSPAAAALPSSSREAVIELVLPEGEARPPVVLVFAATAEEGFLRRRLLVGPLARRGVGAVLLENPLYGARRPAGQKAAILRTVAEQFPPSPPGGRPEVSEHSP